MRHYNVRLHRVGRWNRPVYNIVVTAKDSRMCGTVAEKIGFYSPATPEKYFFLNLERFSYWTMLGARPTIRVITILGKYFPVTVNLK